MAIFDLLFIVVFLTGTGVAIVTAVAALRGRRARAMAMLRHLGVAAAAYLGIVAVVSLASPRRFVDIGDDQCSDDWCIAVTKMAASSSRERPVLPPPAVASSAMRAACSTRRPWFSLISPNGRRLTHRAEGAG